MTPQKSLITILDDSPEIREMLSTALQDAGYDTKSFGRSGDFERAIRTLSPDVCLVDLGLPDKDGLALVNRLALESGAAVIIISGRNLVQDKIIGLELGADDYITKPFETAEVVARVRALLRRNTQKTVETASQVVRFSGWTADFEQYRLTDENGKTQDLSHAESKVLRIFLDAPNRLITRDQIFTALDQTAGENFDRAIDVRVSRLRTKLRDDPQNPQIIKTIYGAGYIFIGNVES
ncbi:DNA-binding response regulator [Amylibacter kogurei]|uniref:DNA-binding response regulator n=1 Tax=Paramylibacter kogurei TaxID=1889778 RepID=A0A2G5K3T4_9RHOB|nr:response regulator transcription factor [Amylibacter kogurei]PIB24075.1 DNA-binding response regulator [Amylibacter kogurei]